MSVDTIPAPVEAYPSACEVAILKVPVGSVARVHHPAGEPRDYAPPLDIPYFVVVPGDRGSIGWGWTEGWYGSLRGVRNGHVPMHREAWHAAARLLARADVVYVRYELRDYYGKPTWTAARAEAHDGARLAVAR